MKIALAFSGGLDTCWCIPVLQKQGFEVTTVTVDVGGLTRQEILEIHDRSSCLGAIDHIWIDAKEVFFDEMLRFLIAGNVLRGATYPLCVGAERALQAKEVARVAMKIGAKAVAHGCTAAGNDQFRFETALRTLAPEIEVKAPVRDLAPSRQEQLELLASKELAFPKQKASYSINSGLWGVTIGGVETQGTTNSIPESAWQRTKGAFETTKLPSKHSISFDQGVPTELDETAMNPVEIIEAVDDLAASYGLGRGIHLGETILGIKGRVAFEAPAASVIIPTHRELEKLTLTKRQIGLKEIVSSFYSEWVHEGLACDPAASCAEALFTESQKHVSGKVEFELRTGSLFITGVSSPFSLHAASRAVYGESVGEWTPEDAKGFGRLYGLAGVLYARTGRST